MNNWQMFFDVLDQYFGFVLRWKVWGIPLVPILIAGVVLGIIIDYVLIAARQEG